MKCSTNYIQEKVNFFFWRTVKGIQKGFPVINGMTRTLYLSHERLVPKSQMELWQEFVKIRDMELPQLPQILYV